MKIRNYRLTPFSIVSRTNVDASCTNVFVLALEKPEIADDSESEDRLDWSKVGKTNLGATHSFLFFVYYTQCECFFFFDLYKQQNYKTPTKYSHM